MLCLAKRFCRVICLDVISLFPSCLHCWLPFAFLATVHFVKIENLVWQQSFWTHLTCGQEVVASNFTRVPHD